MENVWALNPQDNLFIADMEKCLSSDVSASSVLIDNVCKYCPSGTSGFVLKLMHWVLSCWNVGKRLITCIQTCLTLQGHGGLLLTLRHRKMSDVWCNLFFWLKPMCFCLVYTYACSVHRFLSIVQLLSQCSSNTDGKRCKQPNLSQTHSSRHLSTTKIFLYLAYWDFSHSPLAELISDWKHWDGCFPMWRRFSSIKVWSVNLLHYRGHI